MDSHFKLGILLILSLTSCVKPLADTGVIKWDLSSLDLPQMNYNGKTYYIHPDAGEMTYQEALSYCERLNAYEHQDWFLPDKQELIEMFAQAKSLGGFQDAAYWFENPYSDKDSERYLPYNGGNLSSGKGRVRPVRCEKTFSPSITLKQVNEGNWSTFEVTIPKSSRYTIKKAGLSWADPNEYRQNTFSKLLETNKTEGTFQVPLEFKKRLDYDQYYLAAYAELSNGETYYSNVILLKRHSPTVDFRIEKLDVNTVNAIIDIKDWGFPQDFSRILVELSDDELYWDRPYATVERISVKEDILHYEKEWEVHDEMLYLYFNHGNSSFNAYGKFCVRIR